VIEDPILQNERRVRASAKFLHRSAYRMSEACEQNDQFAQVLAIVSSKQLLNTYDTASAIATCTDARDRVQPLLVDSPVSLTPGPLEMLCDAPSQLCSVCSRKETRLRCPLQPHAGRAVCERCWEHDH
jgi:hypothetical protein